MNSKYAPFYGRVLRGMVLVLALSAFVPFLAGLLYKAYGGKWLAATVVFVLASFTLMVMVPKPETLSVAESERVARQLRLPDWSLVSYCAITGLGFTWACVFLWFSGRHAFFSNLVMSVTALTMVFYTAIAFLVARLTGGNWRTVLLVFAFAPSVLAGVVLRLGSLR